MPTEFTIRVKYPTTHQALMEATVRITGPGRVLEEPHDLADPDPISVGTGFILGRPSVTDPSRADLILVTAAHVLEGIEGESASILIRLREPQRQYIRYEHRIRIRDGLTPLWTQHERADVAAMVVGLPVSAMAMRPHGVEALRNDDDFTTFGFGLGDEVFSVGYPYGQESNDLGFAVLRSGRIASHPLVPAHYLRTFSVDFSVFGGQSGSPVYVNQSTTFYDDRARQNLDRRVFGIIGIIVGQALSGHDGQSLGVASVAHATFVAETIANVPEPGSAAPPPEG